ncbi:MAG: paraquat-inducible protein A [Alphaproteobacteria bacterium]|nr:paraquat-inducible protein A [Alphaproteobacteria bacterium]
MKTPRVPLPKAHPYSLSMTANWVERLIGPGLLLSFLLFISGLIIPVASVDRLLFFTGSYSILAFIQELFEQGHYVIGFAITAFSVIFPLLKLFQAARLWWFIDHRSVRIATALKRLEMLGKWSMMDVFVVAIGIVVATSTQLANMTPRIGIYLFGMSVLVGMLAVGRMERLARRITDASKKAQSVSEPR